MNKKSSKKTLIISIVVVAVLIPATVVLSYLLGDRKLYIASVIIMLLGMVPFFVSFEGKKPSARYIAIISVLAAITIVSRIAFMWLPHIKPMAGIIIITAMVFGPGAGFMCGSLSMLISNMVLGQGPWTVWQMFCYGMIGLVAGVLGRRKILSERHVIRTSVIGGIFTIILSVIFLDSSTLFWLTTQLNAATVIAVYVAGIPSNIAIGITTAVTIFLLLKPISLMLKRLSKKYGLDIY